MDFPDELGVFIDYPCLFQHPPGGRRTEEEERLFRQALGDLELWYAHQNTTVFLLTASGTGRSYYERGWPSYECFVSRLLKTRLGNFAWPGVIDVADPSSTR